MCVLRVWELSAPRRKTAQPGLSLIHILGLCVGHDSLFYRYSQAPVTTLVAKDRATGNNPVAAIYCAASYFKTRLDADQP